MKKFWKNKKEKPIIQHVKSELENEAEELSKKYSVWIKAYENGATISAVPCGFGGSLNEFGYYKEFDDGLKILTLKPQGTYCGEVFRGSKDEHNKKYKVPSFEKAVSFVAEKIKEFYEKIEKEKYDSERIYDEEL